MTGARSAGKDRRAGKQTPAERVMAAALRLISTRSYSEGELRDRLSRISARAGTVDTCISRLKELGYVNDSLFAHSYANYRVAAKPIGKARLARELATRKVSQSQINSALDAVFGEGVEESLIDRAIGKRIRTHGRPADRASFKRMFDHLARLGFDYDLIIDKLSMLKANPEHD